MLLLHQGLPLGQPAKRVWVVQCQGLIKVFDRFRPQLLLVLGQSTVVMAWVVLGVDHQTTLELQVGQLIICLGAPKQSQIKMQGHRTVIKAYGQLKMQQGRLDLRQGLAHPSDLVVGRNIHGVQAQHRLVDLQRDGPVFKFLQGVAQLNQQINIVFLVEQCLPIAVFGRQVVTLVDTNAGQNAPRVGVVGHQIQMGLEAIHGLVHLCQLVMGQAGEIMDHWVRVVHPNDLLKTHQGLVTSVGFQKGNPLLQDLLERR